MLEDKMSFLQRVFADWAGYAMPEALTKKLLDIAWEADMPRGTQMISLGELPQNIYFLCKGLCRSYYLDLAGNDVTRFFILEGDFCLTEIQILAERSELCVETLEDCQFLAFQIKDLLQLQTFDYLKDVYIQALQQNIRYKIRRESSFLLMSATERYLDFRKRYPGLEKRITQGQLASYLGITASSLSRIRRVLRQEQELSWGR